MKNRPAFWPRSRSSTWNGNETPLVPLWAPRPVGQSQTHCVNVLGYAGEVTGIAAAQAPTRLGYSPYNYGHVLYIATDYISGPAPPRFSPWWPSVVHRRPQKVAGQLSPMGYTRGCFCCSRLGTVWHRLQLLPQQEMTSCIFRFRLVLQNTFSARMTRNLEKQPSLPYKNACHQDFFYSSIAQSCCRKLSQVWFHPSMPALRHRFRGWVPARPMDTYVHIQTHTSHYIVCVTLDCFMDQIWLDCIAWRYTHITWCYVTFD